MNTVIHLLKTLRWYPVDLFFLMAPSCIEKFLLKCLHIYLISQVILFWKEKKQLFGQFDISHSFLLNSMFYVCILKSDEERLNLFIGKIIKIFLLVMLLQKQNKYKDLIHCNPQVEAMQWTSIAIWINKYRYIHQGNTI